MKYIASCSFGKDSLAAIIARMEHGEPIDRALYARIMFDDETSAELPEHEEFIYNKGIPFLEREYGIKTDIVQSNRTYCDCFYRLYHSGKKTGEVWGFPTLFVPWCNSQLKVNPVEKYHKRCGEYISIVGIASDEPKRIVRARKKGQILPLVDYEITEAMAFDICCKAGVLSPAYDGQRRRLGCWFCHNQRKSELRRLHKEYPQLWGKLMRLDADSPFKFRPDATLHDIDDRFTWEDRQLRFW